MATTSKVTSEEIASLRSHTTMPVKKLTDQNIFANVQEPVVVDSIDPKRISKSANRLTINSAVKAGVVFFATVVSYYLVRTTGIFSYFGLGGKKPNLKDVGSSEIIAAKNKANVLTVGTNLETARQANSPSVNRIAQTYKIGDERVEFKEIKVEEFKDLANTRRSISIQNPILDQQVTVGKLFNLTIDGTNIFSSSGALFLKETNIPTWLASYLSLTFKGSCNTPDVARGVALSGNYAYVAYCGRDYNGLQIIDISNPSNPVFKGSYDTPG